MTNNLLFKNLIRKYYDTLDAMLNDLASQTVGGEEVSVVFNAGKITIKLK